MIRQTRSLGVLVLCSNWNMVFVNYIYDMVGDTQFHKLYGRKKSNYKYSATTHKKPRAAPKDIPGTLYMWSRHRLLERNPLLILSIPTLALFALSTLGWNDRTYPESVWHGWSDRAYDTPVYIPCPYNQIPVYTSVTSTAVFQPVCMNEWYLVCMYCFCT